MIPCFPAGLGEFRIRDLNDEINKLLREKRHWEDRIKELGGPDYGVSHKDIILVHTCLARFSKTLPQNADLLKLSSMFFFCFSKVANRDLNPLSPNSDQDQISPNNIHTLSRDKL